MSTVVEVGRLTADPEVKFVGAKGTALVSFSIAVNRKKGEEESVHYFDCVAWSSLATNIADSLRKGNRVIVTGQLKQDRYETKDGKTASKIVIDVRNIGPDLTYATAVVSPTDFPNNSNKSYRKEADF